MWAVRPFGPHRFFFAISDPKGEEKAFFAERNFDI